MQRERNNERPIERCTHIKREHRFFDGHEKFDNPFLIDTLRKLLTDSVPGHGDPLYTRVGRRVKQGEQRGTEMWLEKGGKRYTGAKGGGKRERVGVWERELAGGRAKKTEAERRKGEREKS